MAWSTKVAATSSTLACGTCCDVDFDSTIRLGALQDVQEVEFDLQLDPLCSGDCTVEAPVIGESSIVSVAPDLFHVCVAAPRGINLGRALARCSGSSGGDGPQIRNETALDHDFFPITPTFPWFGPFGMLGYLPAKFKIRFLEPIYFDEDRMWEDKALVQTVAHEIRARIQANVLDMLKKRKSVWFG